MSSLRVAAAVLGAAMAGLAAVGLVLVALFEVNGFGSGGSRRADPLVLASACLGVLVCAAATVVLWRWLMPGAWPWGLAVLGLAVAVGVLVSGVYA